MNELGMDEQTTILGLLRLGWSLRRIERETGHRRETIAQYGRQAGLLPAKSAKVATDPKPENPPQAPTDSPRSRSACQPYRGFIHGEVAKGRNAIAIYQDLVSHHGYEGAYNAAACRRMCQYTDMARRRFTVAKAM